jgi:hypothetical protein
MSKVAVKKGKYSKKNELNEIKPETIQLKYETALAKEVKTTITDANIKIFHETFIKYLPVSIQKNLAKPFERLVINELLYRYTNIINKLTHKGIHALAKEASRRAIQYIENQPKNLKKPLHKILVEGVAFGQVDHSALKKKPMLELLPEVKVTLKNGGLPYQFNTISALDVNNRRVEKYGELRDLQKFFQIVEKNLRYESIRKINIVGSEYPEKENRPAKESAIVNNIIKETPKLHNNNTIIKDPIENIKDPHLWAKKEAEHKETHVKQIIANQKKQSHQEKLAKIQHLTQEELTVKFGAFLLFLMLLKSMKIAVMQRRSPTKIYEEIRRQKAEERKMLFAERIKREREKHHVVEITR